MVRPLKLTLGDCREGKCREEIYLDGALRVVSRDGLHPSDRAILPVLPEGRTGKALVIGSRYAVLGVAMRLRNPQVEVLCHYDDAWPEQNAQATANAHPELNLTLHLGADPPEGPYDFVILPLEKQGVTDLVRERLRRAAGEWLAPQGLLYSSSDSRDDRFIREEIRKAFGALHMVPDTGRRGGVGYVARRPVKSLVSPPHSTTSFTVLEGERELQFQSRLGVFCSDRLDPGTRALLALARVENARRILDLGCGSGVVGVVAGLRNPEAELVFLDSNARAVESARKNIAQYGLEGRSTVLIGAEPAQALAGLEPVDCILTNPPYYGNWRIAEAFTRAATALLAPGGTLQIVTKSPGWYQEQMKGSYSSIRVENRGGYSVLIVERSS